MTASGLRIDLIYANNLAATSSDVVVSVDDGTPPLTVSITSPLDAAEFDEGADVVVEFELSRAGAAATVNGNAASVVGMAGSYTLQDVEAGSLEITVIATEGGDEAQDSVTVQVNAVPFVALDLTTGQRVHCNVAGAIAGTCEGCSSVEVFWTKSGGSPVSVGVDNDVASGAFSVAKTFVDTFGTSDAGFDGTFTAVGNLIGGGTVNATPVTATVYSPALEAIAGYVDFQDVSSLTLDGSDNVLTVINKKTGAVGNPTVASTYAVRSETALGGVAAGATFDGADGYIALEPAGVAPITGADPAYWQFILHSLADNTPTASRALLSFAQTSNTSNITHTQSLASGRYALTRNDGASAGNIWDPLPAHDNAPHLLEVRSPGDGSGTIFFRTDGGTWASETSTPRTSTPTRWAVGKTATGSGGTQGFIGTISIAVWGNVDEAAAARISEHIAARSGGSVAIHSLTELAGFSQLTAEAWSRNPVNVLWDRQPAADSYTYGGTDYQLVSYGNYLDQLCCARRVRGTNVWTHWVTPFVALGQLDVHNQSISIVDAAGYIHCWGGMHAVPMRYARSTAPNDPSTIPIPLGDSGGGAWVPMIAGQNSVEGSVTYPQAAKFSNGDLCLMFRSGGSGNGNTWLYRYNVTTGWSIICELFRGTTSNHNAYPAHLVIDSQDRVHVAWTIRGNGLGSNDPITSHDVCYAVSAPNPTSGSAWYRSPAMAVAYTLPVTESTAERAQVVPPDSGLTDTGSLCVDDNDYPAYLGAKCVNNAGATPHESDWFFTRWNGSAWTAFTRTGGLAANTYHFTTSSVPLRAFPMPLLLFAEGEFHIIAAPQLDRVGLWRTRATPANAAAGTWTPWAPIYEGPIGPVSPYIDESLWKEDGILQTYIQRCVDDTVGYHPPEVGGMLEITL